mgnify:CR=1 FL=1
MRPQPQQINLAVKRHRLLNELFRRERAGRLELAKHLNMNPAMVGAYMEEFVKAGLVLEEAPMPVGRGRSPVPLRLNPVHGRFLGLDFEALRARVVTTDFSGATLFQKEVPFSPGIRREAVLKKIVALALEAAKHGKGPLLTVGIAAPGQVDVAEGRILHYALLDDFSGVSVRERFQSHFKVPVFVEDNIRSLTLAEMLRGAGRDCRHFLCLAVRSGVGLGIVIDGKLYNGVNGMAGELGYTVFPSRQRAATLTELISAVGVTRQMGASGRPLSAIVKAAATDPRSQALLDKLGEHLGMVAANLANLFAPEKIVLVGEVPSCTLRVRQRMERTFRVHTLPQILKTAHIEEGALCGFAGALGAAYMGFQRIFPTDAAAFLPSSGNHASAE